MTSDADELLSRHLLKLLRNGELSFEVDGVYLSGSGSGHLEECPDAVVVNATGTGGTYGCETGCEYTNLECEVRCPHLPRPVAVTYGEFGELSSLLEDLAAEAGE